MRPVVVQLANVAPHAVASVLGSTHRFCVGCMTVGATHAHALETHAEPGNVEVQSTQPEPQWLASLVRSKQPAPPQAVVSMRGAAQVQSPPTQVDPGRVVVQFSQLAPQWVVSVWLLTQMPAHMSSAGAVQVHVPPTQVEPGNIVEQLLPQPPQLLESLAKLTHERVAPDPHWLGVVPPQLQAPSVQRRLFGQVSPQLPIGPQNVRLLRVEVQRPPQVV